MLERLKNFHNRNRLKGQAELAEQNVAMSSRMDESEKAAEDKISTAESIEDRKADNQ